ncbi:MAG: ornithine carbamoyltransferase [Thermoflexus sp.]|jgi:ornithine carbamoyltransferase|nr:ornithine carbamoyltransferase [Thermoflexus sp.]
MGSLRHFISLVDWTPEEIEALILDAARMKAEWTAGVRPTPLAGKTLGMIFQKPSLRTRVSFEMAMRHLGGDALYLSPQEVGLGQRESVADVARVLSRYVDAIMARVFAHSVLEEMARYATVPVINGLSDDEHPCQALGDVLTVYEKKGRLRGLKLAFVGDGNNVATALLYVCAMLGMDFAIATPPGYMLKEAVIEQGRAFAARSGSRLLFTHDPAEAVRDADILYTDVWASMGQEAEAEARRRVFPPYQVNAALVAKARPDVLVMHCLPAHRGEEITDEVADGPHSVIFDQAENRLHAQKALLVRLLAG